MNPNISVNLHQQNRFDVERWEHPTNPDELFIDLVDAVRRFVVLDNDQAVAIALWIVHTYFINRPGDEQVFDHSPILFITSPERQCGKSRLREIISRLVNKPLNCMNASLASLFREIHNSQPTLMLDEFDNFDLDRKSLIGILNSGYKQDGSVMRQGGKAFDQTHHFSTWSAKLLAGIGNIPDTLQSRCITIKMRRKLHTDSIESVNSILREDQDYFNDIKRKIVDFVIEYEKDIISNVEVSEISDLDDRAQDNWSGLLRVAKFFGQEAFYSAKRSAHILSEPDEDEPSYGIELLKDINEFIHSFVGDHLPSLVLHAYLISIEDRPWKYYKEKTLTTYALSKLLQPYGIKPEQVKHGESPIRGYRVTLLKEAISRYL